MMNRQNLLQHFQPSVRHAVQQFVRRLQLLSRWSVACSRGAANRWLCVSLCLTAFTACDLIDYHPYDVRVDGAHGINARSMARSEAATSGRDSVRFVLISDTQRWYDETLAAVRSINARTDIDFVIHGGDISDFGATQEFEAQRDILEKLRVPYVVILGNHDCLGTGADAYRYIFGSPDFAFNAGDIHFICLNTNAFEYDYSTDIPNFPFLSADLSALPSGIRRTVVAMHAQPKSEQFNNNVAELFEYRITRYPGLAFCLCGHGHHTQLNEWFGDGVLYYECASAKHREYLIFTLKSDGGYSYEVVSY